jgi:rhodanese-related sulfurtransferase
VDENTSARAALTLAQAGYKARALKGGWTEWIDRWHGQEGLRAVAFC